MNGTKRMEVPSKTYISEVIRRYEDKYGSLRKENVPSTPNDHPELDDTPLLDETGITRYQSNIGICQWISTAGRFDITFAVSSLSRFSNKPREGHLKRTEKILGYLKNTRKEDTTWIQGSQFLMQNTKQLYLTSEINTQPSTKK